MFRLSLLTVLAAVILAAHSDTPASAGYINVILNDAPIGYWRFDDPVGATQAADSSGHNRPLNLDGFSASHYQIPGATADGNTALHFDWATATWPVTADFAFAAGESFSFEYWIKVASGHGSSAGAGILTKGYDSSQSKPWYLSRLEGSGDNRRAEVYLRTGADDNANPLGASLVDNQWHHVAGVYDASEAQARLYVDGRSVASVNNVVAAAYGTNDRPFVVGRHGNQWLDASLDEVAMYSTALTLDQVISHYQTGTGTLMVDFGQAIASPRQDQFLQFMANEGGGNPPHTMTFASAFGAEGSVDVTVSGYTHFRNWSAISSASPFHEWSNLLRDSVLRFSEGTMTLTLSGLADGKYGITTFHHGTQYGNGQFAPILLTDGLVTEQAVTSAFTGSGGTNPDWIATQSFTFNVVNGSDVLIQFQGSGTGSNHMQLNGFILVPEPGTAMVALIVLMPLVCRRYRKKLGRPCFCSSNGGLDS